VPIDIYCLTIFPSRGRDVHNEPDLQHLRTVHQDVTSWLYTRTHCRAIHFELSDTDNYC